MGFPVQQYSSACWGNHTGWTGLCLNPDRRLFGWIFQCGGAPCQVGREPALRIKLSRASGATWASIKTTPLNIQRLKTLGSGAKPRCLMAAALGGSIQNGMGAQLVRTRRSTKPGIFIGGSFCLFLVYLIVRMNSSRNIIIEMHLSGQLINNHFDHHCLHWIIDLFREVSVLSVDSISWQIQEWILCYYAEAEQDISTCLPLKAKP